MVVILGKLVGCSSPAHKLSCHIVYFCHLHFYCCCPFVCFATLVALIFVFVCVLGTGEELERV